MMTAILDRARLELDRAEDALKATGLLEMVGYLMSHCWLADEAEWAEHVAALLTEWARCKRQMKEARRIATWNPETGWRRSA